MAIDNDLSALLPDPPPPHPQRREAAVAEALRRFDGSAEPQQPGVRAAPRPVRPIWARPQVAALASAVLVVLVSVPIWWTQRDSILPGAPPPPSSTARSAIDLEPAPAPPTVPEPGRQPAAPAPRAVAAELPAPAAPTASGLATDVARQAAPAPPPPAPAARAPSPPQSEPALRAPAPPPAAQRARQAAGETAADEEESDRQIVVTGSRAEPGNFASRAPIAAVADAAPLDGAWNACTLRDPRRNPTACRESAGRATAQLNGGLALAWQGDLDRAIEAFDRAIAAEPDLALAYLNRGLAWQAKGDLRRALADLNRAVARDRTGARAYYHRSQLHRALGDSARADADAERAIELDPDYKAVLP